MLPEVGDKVRFLNDPIEGTVRRLLPNSRAEVIDSDGFTHIIELHQLVRIEFSWMPLVTNVRLYLLM